MKTAFEEIVPDVNSSFRLMINPKLNDFFFWHFHPEFELVYITGASGNRHVGEHISKYNDSDLVFIGSNIPHLNFDYGVKTAYEKVVVHIKQDFLKEALIVTPELNGINELFENSKHGIAFGSETKAILNNRLKNIHYLKPFEQFLEILGLFQILANATDFELLHTKPIENQHNKREQDRIKNIYQFIDERFQHKISVNEVANLSNLSKAAFCRYFKKMTKLTFTEFLNHYRVNQAKILLMANKNVTETCFECGFESLSYFNRIFKKITSENPMAFKKKYLTR
jgi:AraC-like DNA-binding protein